MNAAASRYSAYTRVDIETASQGKLIVMLFNGAVKRAEEAKRQLLRGNQEGVHNNLIRAQEIVAELRSALDMRAGEIAENLDRLYEYFQHLLIKANLRKDAAPIDECVQLMTQMRDTWAELFDSMARDEQAGAAPAATSAPAPRLNVNGAAVLNLQG